MCGSNYVSDLRSLGFRLPGQRSAPGSIQHISSNGVNLVKSLEGFRAKAYLDSARIPTIGYGHTKNVSHTYTLQYYYLGSPSHAMDTGGFNLKEVCR